MLQDYHDPVCIVLLLAPLPSHTNSAHDEHNDRRIAHGAPGEKLGKPTRPSPRCSRVERTEDRRPEL
eukprot:7792806-Alexandrium_andersonii.AAC.1